jgi:hypothetical protein
MIGGECRPSFRQQGNSDGDNRGDTQQTHDPTFASSGCNNLDPAPNV